MNSSVALFYGEEDFLIEQEISRRKSRLADPAVSTEKIDGKTASPEKIISAFSTVSMFETEKLIIVADFNPDAEQAEQLGAHLKNISPGFEVVFVSQNVDKRKKFYKLIAKIGEVLEFKPFSDWEKERLLSWIINAVHQEKKKIAPHAARLLMEISGKNLRALRSEIDKLVTFIGERGAITEEDVAALASRGAISSFSLMNALRQKDLKAALSAYKVFIRNREAPENLLGSIAAQVRMLLQVKSLEDLGLQAIAAKLGSKPAFVRISLDSAANFALEELKNDLRLVSQASRRLKSGRNKDAVMEVLLADICGRP